MQKKSKFSEAITRHAHELEYKEMESLCRVAINLLRNATTERDIVDARRVFHSVQYKIDKEELRARERIGAF